jgi:hypothetical protein
MTTFLRNSLCLFDPTVKAEHFLLLLNANFNVKQRVKRSILNSNAWFAIKSLLKSRTSIYLASPRRKM